MKQLFLPLVALALAGSVLPGRSQIEYVDPTIGGVSLLLVPTRPTVTLGVESATYPPASLASDPASFAP